MKIASQAKFTVLAKGTTKSKDGQTTYYKLTVLQGCEAGQISCSENVYHLVKENTSVLLNVEYNSEYKSFKVLGIADTSGKDKESVGSK